MHKFSLILASLWTLLILVGCLLSSKNLSKVEIPLLGYDKIIHALLYFGLVMLWLNYLYWAKKINSKNNFITLLLSFFFGVLIEILQKIATADRSADVLDIVFNTIGIILAYITFIVINKNISKSNY